MSAPVRERRVTDLLTRDEIRALTRVSNVRGGLSVAASVLIVAGAMALVAWRPNALTVLCALVLIGARQLAFLVLMHEAAHNALFGPRLVNDAVGKVCGWLVWSHLEPYRRHHIRHHTYTGTDDDPDMGLVDPFPVTRASLARKFLRDLSGITALKRVYGLLAMDLGFIHYTASTAVVPRDRSQRTWARAIEASAVRLVPVLLTNGLLFAVLFALGHGWLYLLWLGAYATTFSLILRIRAMAEHACTERTANPWRNTRTTHASPLARLLLAPHHVNLHLEHHLLMTVPHYHLPRLRALLAKRGGLEGTPQAAGYGELLAKVSGL